MCIIAVGAEVRSHRATSWKRLRLAPSAAESSRQKEAHDDAVECNCWRGPSTLHHSAIFLVVLLLPFLASFSSILLLLYSHTCASFLSFLSPSFSFCCLLLSSFLVSTLLLLALSWSLLLVCYFSSLVDCFTSLLALHCTSNSPCFFYFSTSLQAPPPLYLRSIEGATRILHTLLPYPSVNGS